MYENELDMVLNVPQTWATWVKTASTRVGRSCQVRREADMQIREAEHRHRAELAKEQERVKEAHEMVELIQ